MSNEEMKNPVVDKLNKMESQRYLNVSNASFKDILRKECQVYVCGESYLAKRFDQINYRFCGEEEATQILIDNLYALLRFRYFIKETDETEKKVKDVVDSFKVNLKTTLMKVSFDSRDNCQLMREIPDTAVAFKNGVYDFKENRFILKYTVIEMEKLNNRMYLYDPKVAILWYLNYDFEPLEGISINEMNLEDFISIYKELDKTEKNECFELYYNMSHDEANKFSLQKAIHLSEIMGFTICRSFVQKIGFMIGSGQNGKNALFDGCFSGYALPKPAVEDLETIEEDRFITGSLENHYQNIFLETNAMKHKKSKMIKQLTGSMEQDIEPKGVTKYHGMINCKFLFAGNDQDEIKFSDTTKGFLRRMNMIELFYTWDSEGRYLQKGDYYNTSFNGDLRELKGNINNAYMFVYLAMFGIKSATKDFTEGFEFTYNDWKQKYADVDIEMKERLEDITISDIIKYINNSVREKLPIDDIFYGETIEKSGRRSKLFKSSDFAETHDINDMTFEGMRNMLENVEESSDFFINHNVYIKIDCLKEISKNQSTKTQFTKNIKKAYPKCSLETLGANKPYVKITFINDNLKIA